MRTTSSSIHLKRRKKVLKQAKGFRGSRKNLIRVAKNAVMKAGNHAYISRRQRKREFRSLWIVRINASLRKHQMTYSQFIHALKKQKIDLNRKSLATLCMEDESAFQKLAEQTIQASNQGKK